MYGLGAAVFYIGYFLFGVPRNLLLTKFSACKPFVRIVLLWASASIAMMLVATRCTYMYTTG